jgi:hypothetical protein
MADEGRTVNISSLGDGMATVSLHEFLRRQLTLRGLGTRSYDARSEELRCSRSSAKDSSQPPCIAATIPLARAADAYALVLTHPSGKVALTMSPSRGRDEGSASR